MMGHTGTMGTKYAPSKETIIEEYRRVAPLISVDGQAITQDMDRLTELEQELQRMQAVYELEREDNKELRAAVAALMDQVRRTTPHLWM
jgi:hypothetical protein